VPILQLDLSNPAGHRLPNVKAKPEGSERGWTSTALDFTMTKPAVALRCPVYCTLERRSALELRMFPDPSVEGALP